MMETTKLWIKGGYKETPEFKESVDKKSRILYLQPIQSTSIYTNSDFYTIEDFLSKRYESTLGWYKENIKPKKAPPQ
jgi:hypothetical protein